MATVPFGLKLPVRFRPAAWMRGGPAQRPSGWAWLEPRYPPVAFDLDPKSLSMVHIGQRKKERFIASFGVEDVPSDLLELDFLKARLTSPDRYREIVSRILAKEPVKPKGVSILIPDSYARVAILPFEEMPRSRQDTLELLRHKTKKAVPFKVEDAALDYQVLAGDGGRVNVLSVLTPRSIVEEFESVFAALGVQAGLVDLSTFSLINLYRPVFEKEMAGAGEFLVANVAGTYFTFVIFRGGEMVFFRCKTFAVGTGDDGGEGALRLLKRELQTSMLYYRDKLGGADLSRAYLRIVDLDTAAVSGVFSGEAGIGSVQVIDPRRVINVNGRLSGEHGDRLLQRLAPALGAAAGRAPA